MNWDTMACCMWDPRVYYMPRSLIWAVAGALTLNLMDGLGRSTTKGEVVKNANIIENCRTLLHPNLPNWSAELFVTSGIHDVCAPKIFSLNFLFCR